MEEISPAITDGRGSKGQAAHVRCVVEERSGVDTLGVKAGLSGVRKGEILQDKCRILISGVDSFKLFYLYVLL